MEKKRVLRLVSPGFTRTLAESSVRKRISLNPLPAVARAACARAHSFLHKQNMQDICSHGNIVTSISSTLFSQCQHLCKDVDKDMDFAYAGSLEMSQRMY